jgi:hypothetical protein
MTTIVPAEDPHDDAPAEELSVPESADFTPDTDMPVIDEGDGMIADDGTEPEPLPTYEPVSTGQIALDQEADRRQVRKALGDQIEKVYDAALENQDVGTALAALQFKAHVYGIA